MNVHRAKKNENFDFICNAIYMQGQSFEDAYVCCGYNHWPSYQWQIYFTGFKSSYYAKHRNKIEQASSEINDSIFADNAEYGDMLAFSERYQ